jgi:type I restriction enzyme S subunit
MKSEFLRQAPVNTQGNLNIERIGIQRIAIPSILEQKKIINFIEEETEKLDHSIEKYKLEIYLFQEYRTRLIADVVTGKLDVRAAAAQLPAEMEEILEGEDEAFEDEDDLGDEEDATGENEE